MLWTDLFLLWNRISIYRFICFLLIRKSTVSQTHWNTMLPCIFYIVMLILLLCSVSDKFFIFKHNLCFPAIPLHTTWFQHIPVVRIIREIADWSAILPLSNPQDVQELLGHSDVSTTMNVYAHSTRKAKRNSARLLDKVAGND